MQNKYKIDKTVHADPQGVAIAILGWLAQEPELLGRFLALSGVAPGAMRSAMDDPGFLAGLIDFVMDHEPTLIAFCEATGTAPEAVAAAWQKLSGPGLSSGRILMSCDIRHVALGERPLIVCDIDEVVLEFIDPFGAYLRDNGHELLPRSFHLQGNVVSLLDGSIPDSAAVSAFLEGFFAAQDLWQRPAEHAVETLHALSADADIVFLTAMPPRHQPVRRALLDRFDLAFPMIATEAPKGPVVRQLHGERALPVVFLDDIERNLHSVREHVPDCLLLQIMASPEFRALAPRPTEGIRTAAGWLEAQAAVRSHCGLQ